MDGDWNHIGGSYNDAYGSGSNFTVVDAVTGNRTESGTSTWKTGELDAIASRLRKPAPLSTSMTPIGTLSQVLRQLLTGLQLNMVQIGK